jgi:hypothetical protein
LLDFRWELGLLWKTAQHHLLFFSALFFHILRLYPRSRIPLQYCSFVVEKLMVLSNIGAAQCRQPRDSKDLCKAWLSACFRAQGKTAFPSIWSFHLWVCVLGILHFEFCGI